MIVGVTGFAQHGKDSVGRRLADRWGFDRMQFSAALKEMAYRLNPVIMAGTDRRLRPHVDAYGWESAKSLPEVRRILQVLGTDCVRDIIGEDSWIRALERMWLESGSPNVVITDLRFPNEAEWVHRNGGALVRVSRRVLVGNPRGVENYDWLPYDNGIGTDHPSERFVADLPADFDITNDGDLHDLDVKVDRIAADLAEGFTGVAHDPVLMFPAAVVAEEDYQPPTFSGPWTAYDAEAQTNRDDGHTPQDGHIPGCPGCVPADVPPEGLTIDTFHDDGLA